MPVYQDVVLIFLAMLAVPVVIGMSSTSEKGGHLLFMIVLGCLGYWRWQHLNQARHRSPNPGTHPAVTISVRECVSEDDDEEKDEESGTFRRRTLEEWRADQETLWEGEPRTVEFTHYSEDDGKLRRKVDVSRVTRDSKRTRKLYLHGFCQVRQEERAFSLNAIETMILDRGRRYGASEWVDLLLADDLPRRRKKRP